MSLAPGTRLGPYEITARLGQGAMGEVYRAVDTVLKRPVAIKVLPAAVASDSERLSRLRREAEVLASLNHPGIATIYGVERVDGALALVMELVEGPTLEERIAGTAVSPTETLAIVRQIADALEAAHEQGVVHRDLKPANIKIRADGTVKLLDFGLAKVVDAGAESLQADLPTLANSQTRAVSPTMTADGMLLGTAAYMAPEQAKGKPADKRSDIWAFGVILVEMLTGRRPFAAETVTETIAAVITSEPELDRVPASFQRLARLCLVKDPRGRLRHIGDALALIESVPAIVRVERRSRIRSVVPALVVALFAAAIAAAITAAVLRRRGENDAITRFFVDAPAGTAFNYTYTATAVSPNGRQLVFRVTTATDAPALWLRPLDALEGTRLPSTGGADFPFWSPDGRFVGFFAGGKLKRVDTNGGSPVVICDASADDEVLTGASWNREGVIILGAPHGLYRVSASGGLPVLFAPVDDSLGETGYGSPQFLPDGDRFLMFVRSDAADRVGYYVSSLSQPQRKTRVLSTRSKAIFVAHADDSEGYLLYQQDRTVLARPIDLRSFTLTGEPVPVISDVARFPPGFQASFWSSASGNLLAYRTEASDKPRLTWIYPDGKRQSITDADDFYTHVRVSRDGTHVATELVDSNGNLDVWTWDLARQVKTRQTFDPKPDRAPTWSPDGREIAFSSLRTGVWQLYRKNVSRGQPEEQLTTGPGDKILPEWSSDGRYLLFIQIGTTTAEDIWALPLFGEPQAFAVLQTPAMETNPTLSPDGRWLAFESSQSGRPEVYVTPFPTSASAVSATAPSWQVSRLGGSRPRWSGDGRALLYVSLDELSLLRAEVRAGGAGLESDAPHAFAQIPVMSIARSPFDTSNDGRVLVLERTISHSVPLTVVTNWLKGINRP